MSRKKLKYFLYLTKKKLMPKLKELAPASEGSFGASLKNYFEK